MMEAEIVSEMLAVSPGRPQCIQVYFNVYRKEILRADTLETFESNYFNRFQGCICSAKILRERNEKNGNIH